MDEAKLVESLDSLVSILGDLERIKEQESDILRQILSIVVPFYLNNDEFLEKADLVSTKYAEAMIADTRASDDKRIVSEEIIQSIKNLPKPSLSKQFKTFSDSERIDVLQRLIIIGLLEIDNKGNVVLGSPTINIPVILSRLVYSLEYLNQRETNSQIVKSKGAFGDFDELPVKISEEVLEVAENAQSDLMSELDTFDINTSKTDIYEMGRAFYNRKWGDVYIFSQTSGLIIPTEYSGYIDQNSLCQKYFDDCILNNKGRGGRYYQWDQSRTALELHRQYQKAELEGFGEKFKKDSKKILAKALQSENLELTEAEFDEGQYTIKSSMPLMSKAGLVRSTKRNKQGKISDSVQESYRFLVGSFFSTLDIKATLDEDISWMPSILDKLTNSGKSFSEQVREKVYYNGVKRIIKTKGNKLDASVASDIVDELISIGKSLSTKG